METPEEEIKVRSLVKCLYGNSGHKFWHKELEPFVEVQGISRPKGTPPALKFYGCDEWFHANDFRVISSDEIKAEIERLKSTSAEATALLLDSVSKAQYVEVLNANDELIRALNFIVKLHHIENIKTELNILLSKFQPKKP